MINRDEYKKKLHILLNQYKLSLVDVDPDPEKIQLITQLIADDSLDNLKKMLHHQAIIFLDNEEGCTLIQELSKLCKQHQTFIYWNKVKNAVRVGHASEEQLETYQTAKEIGIDLPPKPPQQSIKPNLRMFGKYRSSLKSVYHQHADAMVEHLDKVSFSQLKVLLKNLAHKLNQHVQDKQYKHVYFLYRGKDKSEYWALQLMYPFLNFKSHDVIEIPPGMDLSSDKNEVIYSKLQEALHAKKSCLVLVDDGTYSGTQCADHVINTAYRLEQLHQKNPDLFDGASIDMVFAFAYATQRAMGLINQALELINQHPIIPCDVRKLINNVYVFREKRVLSVKEMNWGDVQADYETCISSMLDDSQEADRRDNLTMVYTDWRTPDGFSSPASFFESVPPIALCREEKKAGLEAEKKKWRLDNERMIPTSFPCPYK
jgi:hypothetical protein